MHLGGFGGGEGVTASFKLGTHCQTTAVVFRAVHAPFIFLRDMGHHPLKLNMLVTKLCKEKMHSLMQRLPYNM